MADNCVLSSLMTNSTSWSLADDDNLLSVLRDMSQKFLSRTTQIMDKMDKLALKTSSVQVKLDTANNNFLLLSNIKFIEARVYDDNEDVPDELQGNKNSDDIQRSEEEIITEALKHGVNLINTGFEKVQVEGSDSESEDDGDRQFYVLQPINKYHVRQLPAVIGTPEWFDDDKIGLAEEEKQAEDAALSESESEDEEMSKQDVKDESEYSDSEPENKLKSSTAVAAPVASPNHPVYNSESVSEFSDDDDDDLFRPKPKVEVPTESESKVEEAPEIGEEEAPEIEATPKSFAAELSMKLGAPKLLPSITSKPKEDTDDSDEEKSLVNRNKIKSPPTKKSVLFDSSDSEDDLFSGKTSLPKKAVVAKKVPKTEDYQSSISVQNEKSSEKNKEKEILSNMANISENVASIPPPPRKNVFGDSSEEEDDDDIFADLNITQKPPVLNNEEKKTRNVFSMSDEDSDSDDIFADLTGKLKKKEEHPSVDGNLKNDDEDKEFTKNSETRDFPKMKESKDVFLESDSEDNLFADLGSKSMEKTEAVNHNPSETTPIQEKNMDESSGKEEVKKTKPTGGVSIFGKFNPTSLLKRKEKTNVEDELDAEDIAGSNSDDGNYSIKENKTNETKEADEVKPIQPSEKNGIKPINDSEEDFNSIETPALTTITKSRPKVSGSRRPPTRAGRKKVEEISVFDDVVDGKTEIIQSSNTEIINDEQTTPSEKTKLTKAPIGGVSMFGGFNPADLIKKKSKESLDSSPINSRPEDFVEDIQTLPENEEQEEGKRLLDNSSEGNIFMPSAEPPPMNVEVKKKSKDIFEDSDDDDDDMFKDLISKTSSKPSKPGAVGSNLFGFDEEEDSDDDLFADLLKKN